MASLDRSRAERLLSAAGLDALILLSAESFRHATGADSGVATMWRRAGAVAALIPAGALVPAMAVVSDLFAASFRRQSRITDIRLSPIWVEASTIAANDPDPETALPRAWATEQRPTPFQRPTTFDAATCYRHIAEALADRNIRPRRLGVELQAISAADFPALATAFAGIELVDAGSIITRLRMVKSATEIGYLRQAAALAETGIAAVQGAITPGISRDALAGVWSAAIAAGQGRPLTGLLSGNLTGCWEYISVGPNPWGGNAQARPGDLIKVDVGCLISGYTSDSARTFVLGAPSALQARLHRALMAGFSAGSAMLHPGVALAEIHHATQSAIRAAGFPLYARGHFGHSLGLGPGSEEAPFIAADSDACLEPGMVIAFECPWYITGLGGLIIEDQVLITGTGPEPMTHLPHALIRIG